ncbi:MAG TPA: metallopeptidase TldD-related protein [Gemmatimonadaceae bacterium]|nr:metallopeptidase TldD-related protein [Gemmatimonadaceae bacterium]
MSAVPKFMTLDDCKALAERIMGMASGGGHTRVSIESSWIGNTRWARNRVISGGDILNHTVTISRGILERYAFGTTNRLDDESLRQAIRRAETLVPYLGAAPEDLTGRIENQPYVKPNLWNEGTLNLEAAARHDAVVPVVEAAQAAGFLSAGYLQVAAYGRAVIDDRALVRYYPHTLAEYSLTVRNATSTGSGWAGVDQTEWSRIQPDVLGARAIAKCQASADPVAIEPGRYVVILEPQAVADLMNEAMDVMKMGGRVGNEGGPGAYSAGAGPDGLGRTKIGQQMLDERITISSDPMDPDAGFVPLDFDALEVDSVTATTWFEHGVLRALPYDRRYAVRSLHNNVPRPYVGSWRMSGGESTLDEIIASTKRALLVTRFSGIHMIDMASVLCTGTTRDGLWLVENGKIVKPVKNLRFTESPLFAFNNVEMLGKPVRVYHPDGPIVAPPARVRDFSFTSLADAV